MNINRVKKERIIKEIDKSGCDMLKDRLEGDETKEEIIAYLHECRCPVLKEKFSGVEN
jgi:hypothetical protein